MQFDKFMHTQNSEELKNARISDSTAYTEDDSMDQEQPFDIFTHLDYKKNLMTDILTTNVQQIHINNQMLIKLADWLFSNFWRYDMEDQSILLCLSMMQIYLKNRIIQKGRLQALALACMYIASKYVQVKKLSINDVVVLSNGVCTSDDIVELQSQVLSALDFELQLPSFSKYFQILKQHKELSDDESYKIMFWIQVCLLRSLLGDVDQKQVLIEILAFVRNSEQRSEFVSQLIVFISKTQHRYVVKRFLSSFDIDTYLSSIQFQ